MFKEISTNRPDSAKIAVDTEHGDESFALFKITNGVQFIEAVQQLVDLILISCNFLLVLALEQIHLSFYNFGPILHPYKLNQIFRDGNCCGPDWTFYKSRYREHPDTKNSRFGKNPYFFVRLFATPRFNDMSDDEIKQ